MVDSTDMIVFWVVVLARFLIPLSIPRYPLPGVVAALVLDAIDQTIFQQFTSLDLEGYQSYDKALDIYYLTITYISTLRNWTNLFSFKVSRFLWYYRLVGVVIFELTQLRWLLIVFPNTFEYFFIFYEAVRLRWDPRKMSKKLVLGATAFIWIFIKLPQEYWIHIAQVDTTDFLKENIFGVSKDAGASEILQAAPWIVPFLIAIIIVVFLGGRWLLKKLPPADWDLSFDADVNSDTAAIQEEVSVAAVKSERFFDAALAEKIALVALVSIIFAQILPGVQASNLELAIGVGFVIILNTLVSHWLSHGESSWVSNFRQFVAMIAINFALVLVYALLLPTFEGSINLGNTLFFVLLLTLIVTLFDRYRKVYVARFATDGV